MTTMTIKEFSVKMSQSDIITKALDDLFPSPEVLPRASRTARLYARRVATGISPLPIMFPDMLHSMLARVTDSDLYAAIQSHSQEDAGHDDWFRSDLYGMTFQCADEIVFRSDAVRQRAQCYRLLHLIQSWSDREIFAALCTLEAVGDRFFSRCAPFFAEIFPPLELRWFAQKHLEVEQSHTSYDLPMSLGESMYGIREVIAKVQECLIFILQSSTPDLEQLRTACDRAG